jgi:hypothetical protein
VGLAALVNGADLVTQWHERRRVTREYLAVHVIEFPGLPMGVKPFLIVCWSTRREFIEPLTRRVRSGRFEARLVEGKIVAKVHRGPTHGRDRYRAAPLGANLTPRSIANRVAVDPVGVPVEREVSRGVQELLAPAGTLLGVVAVSAQVDLCGYPHSAMKSVTSRSIRKPRT